ncbi:MAG: hypothetical protein NTZ78_07565 [Candidatus Aureabacteria bacterium]|nr:hypothetical protein [Candidatus Auribacterota bacterium]
MTSWRHCLWIMGRFALAALLVWGVFLFRSYMLTMPCEWHTVARAYAALLCFIAIATLFFRLSPPQTKALGTEGRVVWGVLAGACALLFALFYLHDIAYNPLVFFGEWRSSLTSTRIIWNKLSTGSLIPPSRYHLGMGYFYLPLYALLGESIWAVKLLYLACWTVAVGILTVIWWRRYGYEGALSILLVASTLAYGLAALRDYKWHIAAALLAAALFWVASRLERRRGPGGYLLLVGTLAAGIVCYHGCVVYILFMIVYLLLGRESHAGSERGSWTGARGVGLLALIAVAAAAAWACSEFLSGRVVEQLTLIYGGGRWSWNLSHILCTFLSIFFAQTGPVASLALVIGLGAGIADFRRDWIARFSTTGFLVIFAALMLTFPFNDISHANCVVMFVFLIMAYGIYSVLTLIPWTIARQIVVVLLAWCLVRQEYPNYEKYFGVNEQMGCYFGYNMQGVVALYDLRISESPSEGVIFFPAPGMDVAKGGFGEPVHDEVLTMREYFPWKSTLRYFKSLEDLRRGIEGQMAEPAGKPGPIKVYISTAVGRERLGEALHGLNYRCTEIAYFEREWRRRFAAYKVVINASEGGAVKQQP